MMYLTNLLTAAVAEEAPKMFFEPIHFIENLKNMGIGMLVIFVLIGVIILTTMLTNWLFSE